MTDIEQVILFQRRTWKTQRRTWGNNLYSVTSQLPCLFRVSNSREPE